MLNKQNGAYFVFFAIALMFLASVCIFILSLFRVWIVDTNLNHGVIVGSKLVANDVLINQKSQNSLIESVSRVSHQYLKNEPSNSNLVITPSLIQCKNNAKCIAEFMNQKRFAPYTEANVDAQITVNHGHGRFIQAFDADSKTDVSTKTYVRLPEPVAIDVYIIADMSGSMSTPYGPQTHGVRFSRLDALKVAVKSLISKLDSNNKNQNVKNRLAFIGYSNMTADMQGNTYQHSFDFKARHKANPANVLTDLTHGRLNTIRPGTFYLKFHTIPLTENIASVAKEMNTFVAGGTTAAIEGILGAAKEFYKAHHKRHNQVFIIVTDGQDTPEYLSQQGDKGPTDRFERWGFCRKLRNQMELIKDFNHNAFVKTAFYAIRISGKNEKLGAGLTHCVDKEFNPQNSLALNNTFDDIINNLFSGGVYNR
ncbi:VWA domain-containing protein [Vibrio mediterranei]|uniref:vWA domain-containing protein n=1 Tax=Vibrio mediterranei TaxID=689 RepID=UPI001EFEC1D1|nr:vWA domain-containing protein [Vibrio mediterranei]MCG9629081.1 VWA domain-containing protein [Vibrio mediterranei]